MSTSKATPRFLVGHEIGEFILIEYHGFTNINPRTSRVMSKWQHWYKCVCNCYRRTYRSQQELVDPRRVKACNTCLKENNP